MELHIQSFKRLHGVDTDDVILFRREEEHSEPDVPSKHTKLYDDDASKCTKNITDRTHKYLK
jgi:hypothetical protein